MDTKTLTGKRLTLHYGGPNSGTYSFNNVDLTAGDAQCYILADVLNSFQADPMARVTVTETFLIV